MTTLYRKYRPQTWQEVVGQNHIKLTLQREIETGRLAHAFLFSGPRGIGKTTLARLIAKSVNCLNRAAETSEPCNQCISCQEITAGRALDVMEIDAASHTSVDNVRENIIESARFMPSKNKYKVFIIDEAHMLSGSAFNALLKILEEPPGHVIFVLATTELYKLPETIVSRCQRFDFKKVNIENIVKRLKNISDEEKIKVDKKVLEQVAFRSEGCLRDAESLLGQIFSTGAAEITEKEAGLVLPRSEMASATQLLELIVQKNLKEALLFLNNLVEGGIDLTQFSEDLISLGRWLLLSKISGDLGKLNFSLDENIIKTIAKLSAQFSIPQLTQLIEVFLKQKIALRNSPVPQLPLELALVSLIASPIIIPTKAGIHSPNSPLIASHEAAKQSPSLVIPAVIPNEAEKSPLSLDIIQEKWGDFLKKAQEYNHSLPLILKMGRPISVENGRVQVSVHFSFHLDKLNEHKLRQLAEKALSEVLGQSVLIEVILEESAQISPSITPADDLVKNLAAAFGGTVVD